MEGGCVKVVYWKREVFEVLEFEEVIIRFDGVIDICIMKVEFCYGVGFFIKGNIVKGVGIFGLRGYICIRGL